LLRRLPSVADRLLPAAGTRAEQRANTRRHIIQTSALSGGLNWYRALPFTAPRTMNARVRVPTTHVWSDRDVALDRCGAERTGRYVDAPFRLMVLPGVSHWMPEHRPAKLAAISEPPTRQAGE